MLHLATHGYFNRFNPLLSGLELEPDGREDGRLEVHEILGLKLAARLVVLSACDTALGGGYFAEVPSGDDIVGLTRAFLFAGSPSVVASLWAVNDRSTMGLMRAFYGQLRGPSDVERGPRSRAEAREGEGGGAEDKATALAARSATWSRAAAATPTRISGRRSCWWGGCRDEGTGTGRRKQ